MKRLIAPAPYLALASVVAIILRVASSTSLPRPEDPAELVGPPKHKVTPAMLVEAGQSTGSGATPFVAESTDGRSCSLDDLTTGGRPAVLIFIKDGCPCSESAQPYFNRLHAAYGGRARFVGVIGGSAAEARGWAASHEVEFPILADPDLEIVRRYRARNSAYVALVSRDGRIAKLWPGYSSGMLNELGAELSRLSGAPERLIDVSGAPLELYSGCPYGVETAATGL